MAMDFQDKQAKNPFNYNVLKGGQVDPGSKLYQRSIAGREKLSEMLQRLWDQGADEADVFMAGVKALMSRDKGYVGAYLDSKNPGRRYQDNEAKAITDQVMSDLGIGEHPGARLTRPKDGEGKEERKTSNQMRGAFGPGQAGGPPRKAMPVGQQRKLGKRASTGQPVEDSTRPSQEEERQRRAEGRQDYYYPKTDVQRKYMDIMKDGVKDIQSRVDSGQITAEQAVVETSKLKDRAMAQAGREANEVRRYKGDLTKKEQEQADKKQQRTDELRRKIAEQKGLRDREAAAGPEPEEEAIQVNPSIRKSLIVPTIRDILSGKSKFESGQALLDYKKNSVDKGQEDPEYLSDLLNELAQEISDSYREGTEVSIDPSSIKSSIVDTILGSSSISGVFGKGLASLKSAPPEAEQPSAAPEPEAPAPKPDTRDNQTRATDEDVMRRATLGGGKKPAAPAPEPEAPAATAPEAGSKKPAAAPRDISKEIKGKLDEEIFKAIDKINLPETVLKRGVKDTDYANNSPEFIKTLSDLANKYADSIPENAPQKEKEEALYQINSTLADYLDDRVSEESRNPNGTYKVKGIPGPETASPGEQETPAPESGSKKPAAPAPEPEAQTAAPPEPEAPTAGPNRATRRAQGQRGSGPKRGKSQGTGGGGFSITPKDLRAVKEKIAKSTSPEQIKKELEQGTLFPAGLTTETSATNPLEGGSAAAPEPDVPYRTAQERGDEPKTAGRGQAGQGSLMKMKDGEMTTEARSDLKKGQKPRPTSKPAQKKRTKAETQEIQKRGSEELAKTQETNRKLEAMTQRMANSPAVKSEEMRNWINNDLDRLLKSFTPAEKTEDPWEQDGPEAKGIPEPTPQSPSPQRALAGQPGPKGLLSPGKEPQAPTPSSGRRTKAEGDEIRRRGQETLEQLQRGAATERRMANSPVAKREDEINRRGEEALRDIQSSPAPRKGRRTKAEGDEIRRRGQEALEQIRGEARKGREVQSRMANSRAATGEAPSNAREAEITRRGEEALRGEVYENIKNRPGMTNREANRIMREGGYTQPRPGLDAAARTITDGMDRHDAAVKRLRGKRGKISNNAEYQEFAQSIRAMMR